MTLAADTIGLVDPVERQEWRYYAEDGTLLETQPAGGEYFTDEDVARMAKGIGSDLAYKVLWTWRGTPGKRVEL